MSFAPPFAAFHRTEIMTCNRGRITVGARRKILGILAVALVAASAAPAQAQPPPTVVIPGTAGLPAAAPASAAVDPGLIDGPPAPAAPAVMNRNAEGRTTVRAIRLDEGIRLDGVLDEPVYRMVPAITDFIQHVPDNGAPATEPTAAWIMFDNTNVYVSARL